jgi:hypothetical protein
MSLPAAVETGAEVPRCPRKQSITALRRSMPRERCEERVVLACAKSCSQIKGLSAMTNNFPFPSAYPFRLPSDAEIKAQQLRKQAGWTIRNRKPDPLPDRNNFWGRVDTVKRGLFDTASFGTADEIAAAIKSGSFFGLNDGLWGSYDDNLARERAIDEDDAKNRRLYRLGGQVLGGATSAAGLGRLGISAIGHVGSKVLGAGIDGLGQGMLYGFNSGEGGPFRRAANIPEEAAWGAGLGVLGEAALPIGKFVYNRVKGPVSDAFQEVAAPAARAYQGIKEPMESAYDLMQEPMTRAYHHIVKGPALASARYLKSPLAMRYGLPLGNDLANEAWKAGLRYLVDDKAEEALAPNLPEPVEMMSDRRLPLEESGPRPDLDLDPAQRAAYGQAAQRRGDLPADRAKRILRDLMIGPPHTGR